MIENRPTIVCANDEGRPYAANAQKLIASSSNSEKLIAFYEALGVVFERQTDKNGQPAAIGRCQGFAVKFVAGPKASRDPVEPLCFLVEDLDAAMRAVAAHNGSIMEDVHRKSGSRRVVVADVDDRMITLIERADIDPKAASTSAGSSGNPGQLTEDASASLRFGAILNFAAVLLIFATLASWAQFILPELEEQKARPRPQRQFDQRHHAQQQTLPPLSAPAILGLVVATVLQVTGKIQMLPAGTSREKKVMWTAIAMECVGAVALVVHFNKGLDSVTLTLLKAVMGESQLYLLLFTGFLWSVLRRSGDRDTLRCVQVLAGLLAVFALCLAHHFAFGPNDAVAVITGFSFAFALLLYGATMVRLMVKKPSPAAVPMAR